MKLSTFKKFLKNELKDQVFDNYRNHNICSEPDLQCYVWQSIRNYLDSDRQYIYKVLNRCYFENERAYPDIVVFKGNPPAPQTLGSY